MKNYFVTFLIIGISTIAFAQNSKITIGDIIIIQSEILNEERRIAVYTPEDYETSVEKYPILYLLDGEWNFHYVSGLVDKLSTAGDIPKMIVIGIINTNRNRDLTPPEINSNPKMFGGGEKFLSFITQELQPWVEENYRTHPYNILAGHSFGGLFTIYSMTEKPNYFQSYIALSPSLGRNDEKQIKVAESYFNKSNLLPKNLYLAVGNEGGFTYLSTVKLYKIINNNSSLEFRHKFDYLKMEDHFTMPILGFLKGLKFIYEGVNPEKMPELDEIFLIEDHFKQLSERFGYEFIIPEFYFQKFVKEQIGERELEYALFILKKYEDKYPNSPNLLFGYADTYLLKGDFDQAKKYYKKLKQMGIENESLDKILKQIKR